MFKTSKMLNRHLYISIVPLGNIQKITQWEECSSLATSNLSIYTPNNNQIIIFDYTSINNQFGSYWEECP